MIKTYYICLALLSMDGVVNQHNICNNVREIDQITTEFKLDPTLYVSMLWEESNFTPRIKSGANACGIAQVLPQYTDLYNKKKAGRLEKKRVCEELKDLETGLYYGAKALSYWFHSYAKRKSRVSLCAYNAGFRCKEEKLTPKDKRARKRAYQYADKVLRFQRRLKRRIRQIERENPQERIVVEVYK